MGAYRKYILTHMEAGEGWGEAKLLGGDIFSGF